MAILSIYENFAGQAGVNPRLVRIVSNDTLATIIEPGYLNGAVAQGFSFLPTDVLFINYAPNNTSGIFAVTLSNGIYTLEQTEADVIGPTVPNHVAVFANASGSIEDGVTNGATASIYGLTATNNNITATLGNIIASGGNISASAGSVSAGTTMTAAGNITSTAGGAIGQYISAIGLTGATSASRYVGATASGAPVSGTFVIGDYVVARNGTMWVCTVAGSPGTWADVSGGAAPVTSVFGRTGAVVAVAGDYTQNDITNLTTTSSPTFANVTATTAITAGAAITATTGNIVASAGNVQAGSDGNSGYLRSFPAAATSGSFNFVANNNLGNFGVSVENAPFGQDSNIVIPDPGVLNSNFILSNLAGQQTITVPAANAGAVLNLVGDASGGGSQMDQLIIKTATDNNRRLIIGYSQTANAGAIQSVEQTVTVTTLQLNPYGGDVQVGSNGSVYSSKLKIYPSSVASGSMIIAPVNSAGDFTATISNASLALQSTIFTIPDPAAATANFVLDTGVSTMTSSGQIIFQKANGTEVANAVLASGQAGQILTSALTTAAGASYAITWTNTKISATSSIQLTIMGGTNTVWDLNMVATAGAGTSTLTIYNTDVAAALNGTILIGYFIA